MASNIMDWVKERIEEKKTTTTQSGHRVVTPVKVTKVAYVNKVATDGWIGIRLSGNGKIKSFVCNFTKLTLMNVDDSNERVVFRVEDGEFKGKIASMVIKGGVDTYLGTKAPIKSVPTITVKYGKRDGHWASSVRKDIYGKPLILDQQLATLTVNGISVSITLNCDWDKIRNRTPLAVGTYEIEPPDHVHDLAATGYYKVGGKSVNNHGIWFPILPKSEERYIHIGHISHGCVTIIDYDKYPAIHDYLIKHRGKGKDGKKDIVAILEVLK